MVTITNGVNTCTVTNSAFNDIYKKQGFVIVGEKSEKKEEKKASTNDKENADDNFSEKIVEKPISQWSKVEVKRFAEENGIDIYGTKNATEAKEIIKKWLEDNE